MKIFEISTKETKAGRWSKNEQELFIEGLQRFERHWPSISAFIGTRSSTQVRTHAQKYFLKKKRQVLKRERLAQVNENPQHAELKTEKSETNEKENETNFSEKSFKDSESQCDQTSLFGTISFCYYFQTSFQNTFPTC